MTQDFGRRDFFGRILRSAVQTLKPFVHAEDSPKKEVALPPDILQDLTPELLIMEAERLGLDPEKDKSLILDSIQAAMGSPI